MQRRVFAWYSLHTSSAKKLCMFKPKIFKGCAHTMTNNSLRAECVSSHECFPNLSPIFPGKAALKSLERIQILYARVVTPSRNNGKFRNLEEHNIYSQIMESHKFSAVWSWRLRNSAVFALLAWKEVSLRGRGSSENQLHQKVLQPPPSSPL